MNEDATEKELHWEEWTDPDSPWFDQGYCERQYVRSQDLAAMNNRDKALAAGNWAALFW